MSDKISIRLVGLVVILVFFALNVWGYYLYKKGFFGAGADIFSSTSPGIELTNPQSVYMVPGI